MINHDTLFQISSLILMLSYYSTVSIIFHHIPTYCWLSHVITMLVIVIHHHFPSLNHCWLSPWTTMLSRAESTSSFLKETPGPAQQLSRRVPWWLVAASDVRYQPWWYLPHQPAVEPRPSLRHKRVDASYVLVNSNVEECQLQTWICVYIGKNDIYIYYMLHCSGATHGMKRLGGSLTLFRHHEIFWNPQSIGFERQAWWFTRYGMDPTLVNVAKLFCRMNQM